MDQNLSSHGGDMALLYAVQVPHWTCFRIIKLHKGEGVPAPPPPLILLTICQDTPRRTTGKTLWEEAVEKD